MLYKQVLTAARITPRFWRWEKREWPYYYIDYNRLCSVIQPTRRLTGSCFIFNIIVAFSYHSYCGAKVLNRRETRTLNFNHHVEFLTGYLQKKHFHPHGGTLLELRMIIAPTLKKRTIAALLLLCMGALLKTACLDAPSRHAVIVICLIW